MIVSSVLRCEHEPGEEQELYAVAAHIMGMLQGWMWANAELVMARKEAALFCPTHDRMSLEDKRRFTRRDAAAVVRPAGLEPLPGRSGFLARRSLAAAANLRDRRARMMRLAPVSRLAPALDFIGSTSGPLTMKWPLTSRMVSVVIALPYPNPLRRSHKRDRTQ
jgi:hypothetical protein